MKSESGQWNSNPVSQLREIARFVLKVAGISALTAFAENEQIADSRRFTQFSCPNLSERFALLFGRERRDEFLEARIVAKRIEIWVKAQKVWGQITG